MSSDTRTFPFTCAGCRGDKFQLESTLGNWSAFCVSCSDHYQILPDGIAQLLQRGMGRGR